MVRSGLVLVVLATAVLAGCKASDRVDGCTPPANEKALLDEYIKEPVFSVKPGQGSKQRAEPKQETACHKVGQAVTTTSVGVQWDLVRDMTPAEIENMLGPATTGAGWTVVPAGEGTTHVQFCKTILGARSIMDISWQASTVVQGDKRIAPILSIGVRIVEAAEPTCA